MKMLLMAATVALAARAFALMEPATPESQGVPSQAVLDWIDACERTFNGGDSGLVHGFVIVRHGKTIAEGSWKPFDTLNRPHELWSHSKSFTSTAIGFLVDEGRIDLDERLVDIFTNDLPDMVSANLAQLRVRDCLTMNAGKRDHVLRETDGPWARHFLRQPFERQPGTGFRYDSDATFMLAAIVERRSGMSLLDYLNEKLFSKIGIRGVTTGVSPEGIACGGWGMKMTTRSLARFGQFYLQRGRWNGEQLLSSDWVDLASARQTWSGGIAIQSQTIGSGSDWQQGYGFQFWRCRYGAYRADGASGQLTVVLPEADAVVSVHAGLRDMQAELNLIWDILLPAMKDAPLPESPEMSAKLKRRCAELAIPPVSGTEGDIAAFFGEYSISTENPGGLRAIRLGKGANGLEMVLEAQRRSGPFPVGLGEWRVGSCLLNSSRYERLGALVGPTPTAASGGFLPNGEFVVRLYFPETIHGFDIRFAVSNSVGIVRGADINWGGFEGRRVADRDANLGPHASFADFDARAKAGERLTVAFFGGSLTWSANATDPNVTGFRGLMAKYLTEKYPAAHFTFVDAAIGGTGSNLGMFRLERDVLSKKPDLVFLDFACNDGGENTAVAPTCCYEYLLREMIGRGVCVQQMFFTFKGWTKPGAVPAKAHPRRDVYWRLANAYGTPVGDVYEMPLWKKMNAGEVRLETVWPIDGGHPDDGGYRMFADAGIAGFEKAVREGTVCRVPEKPVVGTVKDLRRWNPVDGELPKNWSRKLAYRTSLWYDGLSSRWMEDVAAFSGAERSPLTVEATGNFFGIFGEADDHALTVEISADGKTVASFDGNHRAGPGRLFIWRTVALDGWEDGVSRKHVLAIDPVPSADCKGEFRIGSICTATIVPVGLAADVEEAADEALEELDHERGK